MILTLCGSARYEAYYHEANKQLGLAGHICFSLMTFPSVEGSKTWYTEDQKWTLDLAHFAKIQASDGVVMLNIDGYLGESSLRELKWARMQGKQVYWTIPDDEQMLSNEFYARHLIKKVSASDNWVTWIELISAIDEREKRSSGFNNQLNFSGNPIPERRTGRPWHSSIPQPARRKTDRPT